MNFLGRRSIRKFKEIKVEQEKIEEIMKTAMVAPTGQGKDACEFIVFDSKEDIKKLVGIKAHGCSCLNTATLVIAVLCDKEKAYTLLEDGAVAAHTLQLKAYDLGVSSCWVHMVNRFKEDGTSSEEYFRKLTNTPDNYTVFCLMAMGYADEDKPGYTEKDMNFDKISYGKYGNRK